eukprot:4114407-Prymnesium_polylepis.1
MPLALSRLVCRRLSLTRSHARAWRSCRAGSCALWALVRDDVNHVYVSRGMFDLLSVIIDQMQPRTCYATVAPIWLMAMNPQTLLKIPTLKLIPAMIRAAVEN